MVILLGADLAQRPAGIVDLGNHAAARQRAHDGEAPGIVVGEIFEHGRLADLEDSVPIERIGAGERDAQLTRKSRMKLRFSGTAATGGGADRAGGGGGTRTGMVGPLP